LSGTMPTQQRLGLFGSDVPFAEPPDLRGEFSPFYSEDHRAWRAKVRKFVEEEILPHCEEWDELGEFPGQELRRKAYAAGIYGAMWPREFGGTPPDGSEGDWFGNTVFNSVDPFFDLIYWDELSRCGVGGLQWSLFGPTGIGLPPILLFGSDHLKNLVAKDCITGEKSICLCITEPTGGSDVAGIRTTAVRDGDSWVINGSKKWITGGMKADYFTVLCRTDAQKNGHAGLSLILVERNCPGVTCRRLKTQGWWCSYTTYIEFDNVRVPGINTVGAEGQGFKYTMINFNHERFLLSAGMLRYSRICIEEAVAFAKRRRTFGKQLIEHQVIRHKVFEMASKVEGVHRMLENYCFQVKSGCADKDIGGYVAMMKVCASKTMEFCAREASQIFGGQSYTREGAGGRVERIYREVRVNAIGGGSEEIMINLAMDQAKL